MSTTNNIKYEKRSFKDDTKLMNEAIEARIKCSVCGHTVNMVNVDRIICGWCGHWIYKDSKTEFKYKLLKTIKESE